MLLIFGHSLSALVLLILLMFGCCRWQHRKTEGEGGVIRKQDIAVATAYFIVVVGVFLLI